MTTDRTEGFAQPGPIPAASARRPPPRPPHSDGGSLAGEGPADPDELRAMVVSAIGALVLTKRIRTLLQYLEPAAVKKDVLWEICKFEMNARLQQLSKEQLLAACRAWELGHFGLLIEFADASKGPEKRELPTALRRFGKERSSREVLWALGHELADELFTAHLGFKIIVAHLAPDRENQDRTADGERDRTDEILHFMAIQSNENRGNRRVPPDSMHPRPRDANPE